MIGQAEPAPADEQDRSSAAADMRDQGTLSRDSRDDNAVTSGDVVRSGQSEATDNGRVESDSAQGQLENETQSR